MALGDPYATVDELKAYLRISDSTENAALDDAVATASRWIENYCERQFNQTTMASPRRYYPSTSGLVEVDDFHTTTDLVVETDDGATGTFETTWEQSEYQLEPLDGVVSGVSGWPHWRIRAISNRTFTVDCRATVRVTAQWGWESLPQDVKTACLLIAEETFKLRDAPFGVAGFGDYGPIRVRENPLAIRKLQPYRRYPVKVG